MKRPARAEAWLSLATLGLSGGVGAALWLCYVVRPEQCAALTLWPAWFWVGPGLVLAALGFRRWNRRLGGAILGLWILFLFTCAEEPRALLTCWRPWPNTEWQRARAEGKAIRVVSLNCAGGSEQAAAEVMPYHPDIVLLQEIPSRPELEALAQRLFGKQGAVAAAWDTAVLCRGKAKEVPLPRETRAYAVASHIQPKRGMELHAVSVRLYPPLLSLSLWSADCWRSARQNHALRLRQVKRLAPHIESLPEALPLVVGGDFNAPAGDRIYRVLRPRLRDAYREGGIGLGNTVMNDTPVSRFDQVWVSRQLRPVAVVSRRTKHSDHRMVICDLMLRR